VLELVFFENFYYSFMDKEAISLSRVSVLFHEFQADLGVPSSDRV
jgi:hypothetical protein